MTCDACKHWRTEGALGQHGFGRCSVRPNPLMRAAIHTSGQATCRIGRFIPIAKEKP